MNHIDLYKDPNKIDWKTPVVIDFETYYDKEYSLSKITTEKYIRCDKFECIGVAVKIGNNPTHFYKGETGIGIIRHIVTTTYPNSPVVIQNSAFDAGILAFRYGIHPNFMVDTMVMAKLSGFDRVAGGTSLAKMSAQLEKMGIFSQVKGNEVHNMLGVHAGDMTPRQWQAYGDYCKLDVDLTHSLYMYMIDKVPVSELIMSDITTKMYTKPMFDIDVPLLEQYAVRLETEREQMLSRISGDLGFDSTDDLLKNLRSSKKFVTLLESLQVEVPMKWSEKQEKMIPAVSKTDIAFLELLEHDDELVRTLVETKLGTMSSMEQARTATFLDIASRGLCPVYLRYGAAHTYRMGGGQSQNFQNLTKRTKEPILRRSMRAMDGHIILASDSSSIEARLLAMVANQQDLVDTFVQGRDVYIEMATKIYNKSYDEIYEVAKRNPTKEGKAMRNMGKSCILGMGYSMSAQKFSDTNKQQGVDIPLEQAQDLVNIYRTSYSMIPAFWRECNRVLDILYAGGSCWFGGANNDLFFADGSSEFHGKKIPSIRLPNGTYLFYQNLRKEVKDNGQISYVYDQFKGRNWLPKFVFGGSLTENLCIAEDTLVLTDSGWKKIQDITTKDKVHDGIEFVTHGGLVFKSVKDCVEIDGVYMTKDHEVLTDDGWKTAEVHLSAGATSQLSRFDFSKVLREVQTKPHDCTLSVSTGRNNAETGEAADPKKAVYDILNCGSRNRFVVKGDTAPFVVHNCQALAFDILKWQAIEIAKAGVPVNLNVHDEWVSVVPRDQASQAVVVHYTAMKSVPDYIPQGLLDCEVDVGLTYADLKTVDVGRFL